MYVCLCAGVTDDEIIECSKDGCSFDEMTTKLCVSQNCGCCYQEVERIYNENTSR